jgi:hypothetical protein
MWPECNADFATPVKQPALAHHGFESSKELRGQPFITLERLVILGNKRFTHSEIPNSNVCARRYLENFPQECAKVRDNCGKFTNSQAKARNCFRQEGIAITR